MQVPVLIERIAGNGYRARGAEPLAVTVEGATREEALAKLTEQVHARLGNGAEVVALELPSTPHPLAKFAGVFSPDDPLVQEWIDIMAENRRKMDADPDVP